MGVDPGHKPAAPEHGSYIYLNPCSFASLTDRLLSLAFLSNRDVPHQPTMTHRVQNETIGFHTKFSVRAAGHTTSRRHLGDHLQNHLTFDNTQLLTSVFKVAEVPSTWVTAASEGLDGIHKVFNAFLDTPNGKDLHDPLVSRSPVWQNSSHLTFVWH